MDEKERKRNMDDDIATSLASEGTDLFITCGRHSLICGTQNDIVVS